MYFLPFTFLVPFFCSLLLFLFNKKLSRQQTIFLGVGGLFFSVLSSMIASIFYILDYDAGTVVGVILWKWSSEISLSKSLGLGLDGISVMLTCLVAIVGFLIQMYAVWFLQSQKTFTKILACSSLLIASTQLVLLADNLLLFFLGWIMVTLACFFAIKISAEQTKRQIYHAIKPSIKTSSTSVFISNPSYIKPNKPDTSKFHTRHEHHVANKFFLFSVFIDICLAVAFILLAKEFSTLSIVEITSKANEIFVLNTPILVIITCLLSLSAIAKSAQLPLHTWLISLSSNEQVSFQQSFMPIQVLMQSVTLVTIGVYLLIRFYPLYVLTPDILTWWVGLIGASSIIFGALGASSNTNINTVISFSTMSQIGFVFVAIALGSIDLAIFHLVIHAVIKSLLMISSSAIVQVCKGQVNILKLRGLRHKHSLLLLSWIVGGVALMGMPFITTGYFSLKSILLIAEQSSVPYLFYTMIVGIYLTAFYVCRFLWYVFFGKTSTKSNQLQENAKLSFLIPIIILMLFSTTFGMVFSPNIMNLLPVVSVTMADTTLHSYQVEFLMVSSMTIGIISIWLLYVVNQSKLISIIMRFKLATVFLQLCSQGFGFHALYDALYLKVFRWLYLRNNPDIGIERSEPSKSMMISNHFACFYTLLFTSLITLILVYQVSTSSN